MTSTRPARWTFPAALPTIAPSGTMSAHNDVPCGVYDPAQANEIDEIFWETNTR